jgi:general secretion pathway protein F
MPVREAVQGLRESGTLRGSVGDGIERALRDGGTLAEALRRFPQTFAPEEVAIVAAGEETGRLDAILDRLVELREESRRAQSRFVTQMGYPLLIFHVAAIAMPIGLVATFTGRINFTLALTFTFCIVVGFWAAVVAAFVLSQTAAGREKVRSIVEPVPGLGAAVRHRRQAMFATVLEAAYESGVTLDRGVRLASEASGTTRGELAADLIAAGKPLADALPSTAALPPDLIARVANAEKAGDLSTELRRIALEEFRAAGTALDRTVGIVTKGFYALLVLGVLFYALTMLGRLPRL